MAATKKAAFFKVNPGGANVINTPVLPGANGTWTNYTGNEAAGQSAQVAAGYLDFDYPDADGNLAGYRIPFYTNG
jgi:hypothetical protein